MKINYLCICPFPPVYATQSINVNLISLYQSHTWQSGRFSQSPIFFAVTINEYILNNTPSKPSETEAGMDLSLIKW